MARDQRGEPIDPADGKACCWCITGALEKACEEAGADAAIHSRVVALLGDASESLFGTRLIAQVNDQHGHDAVCRLIEQAIAQASVMAAVAASEPETSENGRLKAALGLCLARITSLEQLLDSARDATLSETLPAGRGIAKLVSQIQREMAGPAH